MLSHPLPDGSILTNNYVADEYGFRSSLASTAHKDFASRVKSTYEVHAPVVQHTVETSVIPQSPLVKTKSVDYEYATAPVAVPVFNAAYAEPIVAKQSSVNYAAQPLYRSYVGYNQPRYYNDYPAYYSARPVRRFGYRFW